MLRVIDLGASYAQAAVLHGVSLHVERGESVTLLGPNGAGKSTLMAAITGTIARRSGSVRLEDRELVREPSHAIVRHGVALVPEGRLVFAPFSVEDNLRLGAMRFFRASPSGAARQPARSRAANSRCSPSAGR